MVQCRTVQFIEEEYHSGQFSKKQRGAVQHRTKQSRKEEHGAEQFKRERQISV